MISERLGEGVARVRKYFSSRTLILLYHRVAGADSDPWQLAVTPQHFEEHLQVLRSRFRLFRMGELRAAIDDGNLPRRRVVVTFDDGYADNLLTAKPLLEKYDVPATAFIATGYTGEAREFWWDELERLFIQPAVLPRILRLRVNGGERKWELGDAAGDAGKLNQRHRDWRACEESPTQRHAIYVALWQLMQPMPEEERLVVRNALLEWAGDSGAARETHRVLGPEEIVDLTRGGLIEVGCHTVSHPQLSSLNREAQRDEIRRCKETLEGIVTHSVQGFAYPYGGAGDYTAETVAQVRDAGFDYSCTTSMAVVERGADPFKLPRVQVTDMDGDSFDRFISEWLN